MKKLVLNVLKPTYFSLRRAPIFMLISYLASDLYQMVIFGGAMKAEGSQARFVNKQSKTILSSCISDQDLVRCFSLFLINKSIYYICYSDDQMSESHAKFLIGIASSFDLVNQILTYFYQDCKSWKTEHLIYTAIPYREVQGNTGKTL